MRVALTGSSSTSGRTIDIGVGTGREISVGASRTSVTASNVGGSSSFSGSRGGADTIVALPTLGASDATMRVSEPGDDRSSRSNAASSASRFASSSAATRFTQSATSLSVAGGIAISIARAISSAVA